MIWIALLVGAAVVASFFFYAWLKRVRHFQMLRATRVGLEFDEFVQSFPGTNEDEVELLGRVYKFFSEMAPGRSFPVRADDSIREIFWIEDEDVSDDVLALARKCGGQHVSPSRAADVITVRDVVELLHLARQGVPRSHSRSDRIPDT